MAIWLGYLVCWLRSRPPSNNIGPHGLKDRRSRQVLNNILVAADHNGQGSFFCVPISPTGYTARPALRDAAPGSRFINTCFGQLGWWWSAISISTAPSGVFDNTRTAKIDFSPHPLQPTMVMTTSLFCRARPLTVTPVCTFSCTTAFVLALVHKRNVM